jgi:hypothetical protein
MNKFTEQDIKGILVTFFRDGTKGDYLEALNEAVSQLISPKEVNKSEGISTETTWNYRIGTRLVKYTDEVKAIKGEETWREYLIFSCYYTNNIPDGCGESNNTNGFDDLEDLKKTIDYIYSCTEKDVLDLDNFPQVFKA